MATFLMVLQVVVALLLICVVLIQEPKSTGGGLFSGTGQSLLGTSGKTFWTKFTTGLAVVFFVLCLALAALPKNPSGSSLADDIQRTQEQAAAAAASAASQAAPKTDAAVPAKAPAAAEPAANAPATKKTTK